MYGSEQKTATLITLEIDSLSAWLTFRPDIRIIVFFCCCCCFFCEIAKTIIKKYATLELMQSPHCLSSPVHL